MAIPPSIWLAGTLGAVWLGMRKLRRYLPVHDAHPSETGTDTVRCARCDVFVPRSHAVEHQGRWYCGNEHAGLTPKS